MAPDDIFTKFAGKTSIKGVKTDKFGNPEGSEFDLAKDGAFRGFTIAVLHLYTGEGFDFSLPTTALKEKGFDIVRWERAPDIDDFKKELAKACQLWIISNSYNILDDKHLDEIKNFFDKGYGVYIWGDNEPYYADANRVAKKLFGITMNGNLYGDQVVEQRKLDTTLGFIPHLLSTGLNYLYEGITIATIQDSNELTPFMYGSAQNLVTAIYDKSGKRAIIDGGFTRLFCHWDTAGSGRYVKNAAAWLANYDQWGRPPGNNFCHGIPHDAEARDLAGQIKSGEESQRLYYIVNKRSTLKIEAYWEREEKAVVAVFNQSGELIKEENKTGKEISFTIENELGICSAIIKFPGKSKKKHNFIMTLSN